MWRANRSALQGFSRESHSRRRQARLAPMPSRWHGNERRKTGAGSRSRRRAAMQKMLLAWRLPQPPLPRPQRTPILPRRREHNRTTSDYGVVVRGRYRNLPRGSSPSVVYRVSVKLVRLFFDESSTCPVSRSVHYPHLLTTLNINHAIDRIDLRYSNTVRSQLWKCTMRRST